MKFFYVEHPAKTRIRGMYNPDGTELICNLSVNIEHGVFDHTSRELSIIATALLKDYLNQEVTK